MITKTKNILSKNLGQFDCLKYLLGEGELITIAGVVSFNTNLNQYEINDPLLIQVGDSITNLENVINDVINIMNATKYHALAAIFITLT